MRRYAAKPIISRSNVASEPFSNSSRWPILSSVRRTIVYDHRGTGETSVPVEKITDEALVDDVFRVMDALNVDRCVLSGFSRGSITAMRAALRDPARFEGPVLMNGTGGVQLPDAPLRPRIAPSQWPGATYRKRLSWFIEGCTPEQDVEHIRRWGVTIHAVDRNGNVRVVAVNVPDDIHYWYWCETMARPQCRSAERI